MFQNAFLHLCHFNLDVLYLLGLLIILHVAEDLLLVGDFREAFLILLELVLHNRDDSLLGLVHRRCQPFSLAAPNLVSLVLDLDPMKIRFLIIAPLREPEILGLQNEVIQSHTVGLLTLIHNFVVGVRQNGDEQIKHHNLKEHCSEDEKEPVLKIKIISAEVAKTQQVIMGNLSQKVIFSKGYKSLLVLRVLHFLDANLEKCRPEKDEG